MKAFSDLEQSKVLAEILPLESADMYYEKGNVIGGSDRVQFGNYADMRIAENMLGIKIIPCWSLEALLGVIPTMISSIFKRNALRLRIDKSETDFNIWYDNIDTGMVEEGFDIIETNPIDACYEMVIRLNELNLL